MDRFSPIAPACVRVLLLPVHQIERSTFTSLVRAIQEDASVVKLQDLAPQVKDENLLLSPLRFEAGSLLYNFCIAEAHEQARQLSPFELWRETLLVIGIADGLSDDTKQRDDQIRGAETELHDKHGRVVYRHLLVASHGEETPEASDVTHIDPADAGSITSAIQRVTIRFLEELSTYAAAMQASPGIQTPGNTAQGPLRSSILREEDSRPSSRQSGTEPRSPSGDDMSRPTSQEVMPPPATTFDQMPVANGLARSDSLSGHRSKSHQRTSSFDRVPSLATSKEKLKDRGKARVGIVTASIYLMAGQWAEALKLLVESTTRLRSLNDHIWNGKGLELIAVCLLLHMWAGVDVQIPAIIFQLTDKIRDRLSKSFAADLAQKLTSPLSPIEKLSSSLHDLLRHILVLYHAIEGTMELPFLAIAEARVRFCKILASLQSTNGVLNERSISWIVDRKSHLTSTITWSASTFQPTKPMTKQGIADMLGRALPASDEVVPLADQIALLAGVASVYAMLKLDRKKAITLKALVTRLTAALSQARKLGAAEMGIHPSATLVIDQGSHSLLDEVDGSKGLSQLAQELASVYGVGIGDEPAAKHFGSRALQLEILRELLKLCEASPDLQGITKLVVAFMTSADSGGAIDLRSRRRSLTARADEQAHMIAMFNRASWLSRQLGVVDHQPQYWDAFMLRGMEVVPAASEQALIQLAATRPSTSTQSAANPLLYDPNAPVAKSGPKKSVLARGEAATLCLHLQNPFDITVDIEYIKLVTEGLSLACSHKDVQLAPACLQRAMVDIYPEEVGNANITGCLIKVAGCAEQTFLLTPKPYKSPDLLKIKDTGQTALGTSTSIAQPAIEHDQLVVEVIEKQPQLIIDEPEVAKQCMLLEGESQTHRIAVKNISDTPAVIININCMSSSIRSMADLEPGITVEPAQTFEHTFIISGEPKSTIAQAMITYAASSDSKYARSCTLTWNTTVRLALQVVNVSIQDTGNDSVRVFLDLCNLWKTPLGITCSLTQTDTATSSQHITLHAGQTGRTYLDVARSALPDTQDHFLKALIVDYSSTTAPSDRHRKGRAMLQNVQLSEQSLLALKRATVDVSLSLSDATSTTSASSIIRIGELVSIRAHIKNNTATAIPPSILQLRQLDINDTAQERRACFAGPLSRILSTIPPHGEMNIDFSLCPLLLGNLTMDATVRPALQPATETQLNCRTTRILQVCVMY